MTSANMQEQDGHSPKRGPASCDVPIIMMCMCICAWMDINVSASAAAQQPIDQPASLRLIHLSTPQSIHNGVDS